ncbi:MAG: tRNA pseudouridine(38-40) synthase TruA [Desulfobulbus propionicus]|nr:MAG: tRNA pseudouridine(38-40) synthase TruA [Desulfobulbus propionicus]
MQRTIRLLISFDGTNYHGWQRQHNALTVQEVIEQQLAIICKKPINLHGAGRTDSGVHALGMVAHFHLDLPIALAAFDKGLNSMLPKDIRILKAVEERADFHSRFSALGKTYRYDFFTGEIQTPISRLYAAHFPGFFSLESVNTALDILTGTHDFSSFECAGSRDIYREGGRGAVRTIFKATCTPHSFYPEFWSISLTGDGFLRQMARIIAGTSIEIGQRKRDAQSMLEILQAKDRKAAGLTAPAHGLFLEQIYYNELFRV